MQNIKHEIKTKIDDLSTEASNLIKHIDELLDAIRDYAQGGEVYDENTSLYIDEQKEELLYQLRKHRDDIDDAIEGVNWL